MGHLDGVMDTWAVFQEQNQKPEWFLHLTPAGELS